MQGAERLAGDDQRRQAGSRARHAEDLGERGVASYGNQPGRRDREPADGHASGHRCRKTDGPGRRARLFLFPIRRVQRDEDAVIEVDESGQRLGEIDMEGGLATRLDRWEDFRLDDPYQVAFRTVVAPCSAVSAGRGRCGAKWSCPTSPSTRSVATATWPGRWWPYAGDDVGLCGDCDSATMAFCVSLRGMQQALLDLIDSPELVHRLMEKRGDLRDRAGQVPRGLRAANPAAERFGGQYVPSFRRARGRSSSSPT